MAAAAAPIQNNNTDNDYDDEDDGDDDVCNRPCVSDYSISDPEYQDRDEQKCDDPLTKSYEFGAQCFKADTDHARFYKKIGKNKWMTYVPIILESFIYKCHLNNTHETNVFRKVLTHFDTGYGAISIHINHHQRENYKYCGDMIRFYKIQYRKQVQLKDFFHITLHTEKPRHIFFQTRNRSACAAWPRRYGDKKGSLHYRIDATSKIFDPALRPANNKKPYKPFLPIRDAKLASSPDNRFIQSDEWRGDVESNRTLSVIHEYLYIQFIRHWNRCITAVLDDVSIESIDAPWHGSSNNNILDIDEQDQQLHHFEIAIQNTLGARQPPGNLFLAIPSVQKAYDDIHEMRQKTEAAKAKNKKAASSMANQIRKQREGKTTTLKNASHVTEQVADHLASASAAVSSAISATQMAVAELTTASEAVSSASIAASPASSVNAVKKVGKKARKTAKKKQSQQNQPSQENQELFNNGAAAAASSDTVLEENWRPHLRASVKAPWWKDLPLDTTIADFSRGYIRRYGAPPNSMLQTEQLERMRNARTTATAEREVQREEERRKEEIQASKMMANLLKALPTSGKKGKKGGRTRKRRVYRRRTHKK